MMKNYTLEDLIDIDLEGYAAAEADEDSSLEEYPAAEQEVSYGGDK